MRKYSNYELKNLYGVKGDFRIVTFFVPSKLLYFQLIRYFYSLIYAISIKNKGFDLIFSRLAVVELSFISREIPVIYEMHSPGPFNKDEKNRNRFVKLLNRKKFIRLIVTTNILKEIVTSELYENNIEIDVQVARLSAEYPISFSAEEIDDFKKMNFINPGKFIVGYTGVLMNVELRGIPLILSIAKKLPEVDFHIVGGSEDDINGYTEQKKLNNIFFHGYQNPKSIPLFLSCFDLVINPLRLIKENNFKSIRNFSPLKISRYLAYAKVIIASNIPQHNELIKSYFNGILVKDGDVEAYVCAINEVMRMSKKDVDYISKNAFLTYKNNLTPTKRMKSIFGGLELQDD